jgi:hypothetical protein
MNPSVTAEIPPAGFAASAVELGFRYHFTSACPIMLSKLCWSLGDV